MFRMAPLNRVPNSLVGYMVAKRAGEPFFLIGPERDHTIFTGLDAPFSTIADAKYVICTGLFDDEVETPDNYRDMLKDIRARNLFFLCANPDIVVERGDKLIYCAGALADGTHARRDHGNFTAHRCDQRRHDGQEAHIRQDVRVHDVVELGFGGKAGRSRNGTHRPAQVAG